MQLITLEGWSLWPLIRGKWSRKGRGHMVLECDVVRSWETGAVSHYPVSSGHSGIMTSPTSTSRWTQRGCGREERRGQLLDSWTDSSNDKWIFRCCKIYYSRNVLVYGANNSIEEMMIALFELFRQWWWCIMSLMRNLNRYIQNNSKMGAKQVVFFRSFSETIQKYNINVQETKNNSQ